MEDPWVSLLIGGTILLVGFAAYLLFQRYRIPDFFVLMMLGAVLGVIPIAPFGPGLLASLGSLLPASEGAFILEILPTTVLISAIVCALLLVWADRTAPPAPAAEAVPPPTEPQPQESTGD